MENKTGSAPSEFIPPRHWVGLEELDAKYWDDPTKLESRGQEFFEKPVEYLEKLDGSEQGGMARRDFLTVMGASMAMATLSCARRPVHKIIPYVVQPESVVPGIPIYYASTSKECKHGCGILIKTREGRPIKLEGNPDHPVNAGKLCGQAQASVLSLYDTDRLTGPLAHDRGGSSAREVSWSEADQAIVSKLKGARRVRVLSGELRSDSTEKLIREFLAGFPATGAAGEHVVYEPLALDEVAEAQALSYGAAVMPHYGFDRADVVLSLGLDFLGVGSSAVGDAGAWAKKRKLESKSASSSGATLSKFYCFESTFTITGANADERYAVRPGDELKIALAVAHELLVAGKKSALAGDSALAARLAGYKPEIVAEEIGFAKGGAQEGAKTIRKIASDLWEHRGKSLVVAGGVSSRTKDALSLQLAVNLLNSALENEGATVDGTAEASEAVPGLAGLTRLMGEMKSGAVDALIIYRANPVFTFPEAGALEEALRKVPLVVAIGDRDDETAKFADFVLPDHHYLENWGDWTPRRGVRSLQQPAISPIHSTRAFEDSLLVWSKAGAGGSGLAKTAPDWHEYLRENWRQGIYKASGAVAGFEEFWEGALRAGVLAMGVGKAGGAKAARAFKAASLSLLPQYAAGEGGIRLAMYENIALRDGRNANNPWLQELPDPISSATWDNYLAVSPSLAKKLSVANDDVVRVSADDVSVELPIYVQPGMHSSVVAVAVGYGRRAAGKVGNGAGADVYPLAQVLGGRVAYSGRPVSIAKTQKFYKLATTQWHTVTENRPVLNDITLAEYRKNPGASMETDPELRPENLQTMWPVHEYKGYRWGMAIDLTSCIGCGACMIGCQAENNIPVVGREQVRVSRQMHWIRIDRYYSGSPENPDVVFQPMLCQHCENAPCETVCPVVATVHDDEGLNVQVYNRCVGTRYCQNNCPYKVRRFNFFDHWKSYKGTMNMAWNPDVTVRTRGIMEKCTFCVQRIVEAKDKAKDRGEHVTDSDLKSACQQTCPTDAIVFGDMNNPASRVAKLRGDVRAFRVLETLNTRPSISYMTKVRNKEEENAHV